MSRLYPFETADEIYVAEYSSKGNSSLWYKDVSRRHPTGPIRTGPMMHSLSLAIPHYLPDVNEPQALSGQEYGGVAWDGELK